MTTAIRNVNDGSTQPPRLSCWLNTGTLAELPAWSSLKRREGLDFWEGMLEAGFEGFQGVDSKVAEALGVRHATGGRVNKPEDAQTIAKQAKDLNAVAATVHVGWGLEDDAEVDRLVGAVIEASVAHDVPIYIETHRATVTQDNWRTVQIAKRFPGVRFNGDFSHWYTGLEMRYGGVPMKLDHAAPVFERVRFMHGRIGSAGCMQVFVGNTVEEAVEREYVKDFLEMWTRAMVGFLRDAKPGDVLVFAPELLHAPIYYARTFPGPDGTPREECDRWQQAVLYIDLAKRAWAAAQERVKSLT